MLNIHSKTRGYKTAWAANVSVKKKRLSLRARGEMRVELLENSTLTAHINGDGN